jgi:hypothetical protein
MTPKQSDRRTFLKSGAVLAGLAVGAPVVGNSLPPNRSRNVSMNCTCTVSSLVS